MKLWADSLKDTENGHAFKLDNQDKEHSNK